MPELPEVETVVKGLKEQIVGQEIAQMSILFQRLIMTPIDTFIAQTVHQKIIDIERFGKYILIILSNQQVIRIHLRMEGKFFLTTVKTNPDLDKHVHLIVKFRSGRYLKYHDVRKFGTFELIDRQTNWHEDGKFANLGYEPWEAQMTTDFLFARMQASKQMIKPFLLDQKTIVGLGNIYVDEVLFQSKIHPMTRAATLNKKQAGIIRTASINILHEAIAFGGTTIRSYHNTLGIDGLFQNKLRVHNQKDQACPVCGTPIIKIKVAGRGTYLCPECQKLKER